MPAHTTVGSVTAVPSLQEPIQTTGSIISLEPDGDGCEITFSESAHALPIQVYQLQIGTANYNAMYALLLACWINKLIVDIYHRASLLAVPAPSAPSPQIVTSVRGRYFTD
jgi:hypothetical protein